jgi:hypothetical protein
VKRGLLKTDLHPPAEKELHISFFFSQSVLVGTSDLHQRPPLMLQRSHAAICLSDHRSRPPSSCVENGVPLPGSVYLASSAAFTRSGVRGI